MLETGRLTYLKLVKVSLLNLKHSLFYYKLEILLVIVKLINILNLFAYGNSIIFLALHPVSSSLIDLLNINN